MKLLISANFEDTDRITERLEAALRNAGASGTIALWQLAPVAQLKSKETRKESTWGTGEKPKKQANTFFDLAVQQRFGAIFHRKVTTAWSKKELDALKKISPIDEYELALIERYYKAERGNSKSICRRDLETLLNNYRGEVDRALAWCEKHPLPIERKFKPKLGLPPPVLPPVDPESEAKFLADFERVHGRLPYGYKKNGQ